MTPSVSATKTVMSNLVNVEYLVAQPNKDDIRVLWSLERASNGGLQLELFLREQVIASVPVTRSGLHQAMSACVNAMRDTFEREIAAVTEAADVSVGPIQRILDRTLETV